MAGADLMVTNARIRTLDEAAKRSSGCRAIDAGCMCVETRPRLPVCTRGCLGARRGGRAQGQVHENKSHLHPECAGSMWPGICPCQCVMSEHLMQMVGNRPLLADTKSFSEEIERLFAEYIASDMSWALGKSANRENRNRRAADHRAGRAQKRREQKEADEGHRNANVLAERTCGMAGLADQSPTGDARCRAPRTERGEPTFRCRQARGR